MKMKLWRTDLACLLPVTVNKALPSVMRERPEEVVFALCYMTLLTLIQLPFEKIGGYRVPTFLFKGKPSIYHAFFVSLMFAFSCSASCMTGREEYTKAVSFCRRLAIISILVSAVILMWVAALAGFRWVLTLA
ncbi:hypothetical protein NE237_008176 [Protea cynaroides]|uniref:Uncharacterized protein n=1 Tax=Protea cynaroides TaxID=273540 RepID=A0A9Q0KQT8_9MAGN|nr:hypothetical protein NE237_008176 [Protea cynaroides]